MNGIFLQNRSFLNDVMGQGPIMVIDVCLYPMRKIWWRPKEPDPTGDAKSLEHDGPLTRGRFSITRWLRVSPFLTLRTRSLGVASVLIHWVQARSSMSWVIISSMVILKFVLFSILLKEADLPEGTGGLNGTHQRKSPCYWRRRRLFYQ
jgi:hypothetical protein